MVRTALVVVLVLVALMATGLVVVYAFSEESCETTTRDGPAPGRDDVLVRSCERVWPWEQEQR